MNEESSSDDSATAATGGADSAGRSAEARRREDWLTKVYEAGGDAARLARHYDAWAASYDEDVIGLGYVNPALVSGLVCRHLPDPQARILDAGAGTGMIGRLLTLLGYRELTAIDLSEGMLGRAAALGVYRVLRQMDLGARLDFPDDAFDGCVASGVLTVGHAPPRALDELVRVVRPGGVLVMSITDKAHAEGGFGARMDALEAAGAWRPLAVSGSYVALPGASASTGHGSRMFVYRVDKQSKPQNNANNEQGEEVKP